MIEDEPEPELSWRVLRIWLYGFIISVFFLGDLFLPNALSHGEPFPGSSIFFGGALAAQPALLAFWCAVGTERFHVRLLATFTLTVLSCSAYIVGLQIPKDPNGEITLWLATAIFAIGISIFVVAALLFTAIGMMTRQRVVDTILPPVNLIDAHGYSIRHVIILTTLVALGVVGIRAILPSPDVGLNYPSSVQIILAILFAINLICIIPLLICAAVIVLRQRLHLITRVLANLAVLLVIGVNVLLLSAVVPLRLASGPLFFNLIFLVGYLVTVTIVFLLLKGVGYRLGPYEEPVDSSPA